MSEAFIILYFVPNLLSSPSLWVALFAAYGGPILLAAFLKLLQDALAFAQPQFLRLILSFISTYRVSKDWRSIQGPSPFEGIAIALIMFGASMVQTVILQQVSFYPFLTSAQSTKR